MQIALPGSLHRVIVSLCSSVHSVTTPQPRRTMQIALAGSLHRVIMWLCTQSQLSTTVEAHDADRPAGLAASCHRVAVHSLTAIHHSRGTRCRSPCRACCIVSLWALFQLSATCVQSAPVCESPASGAVTLAVQTSPFFFEKAPTLHKHLGPPPQQAQGRTCCSSPWRAHCTLCAIYDSLQVHNPLVLVLYHSA